MKEYAWEKYNFCGRFHKLSECAAYGEEYYKGNKRNHFESCRMTKKAHKSSTKSNDDFLIEVAEATQKKKEKSAEVFAIYRINNKRKK